MKIQQINETYMTSLPKAICNAKGWSKGTDLKYKVNDKGELVLY